MTNLSFGLPTVNTMQGSTNNGTTPVLSYGNGTPAVGGNLTFWTPGTPLDMGTATTDASLALSGPLGGGGTPNVPSSSTVAAQQAAAAAANNAANGYGATGFVYTMGQLAQAALAPAAAQNPPTLQPTNAAYHPGGGTASTSKGMEIALIVGALALLWMLK